MGILPIVVSILAGTTVDLSLVEDTPTASKELGKPLRRLRLSKKYGICLNSDNVEAIQVTEANAMDIARATGGVTVSISGGSGLSYKQRIMYEPHIGVAHVGDWVVTIEGDIMFILSEPTFNQIIYKLGDNDATEPSALEGHELGEKVTA